MKTFTAYVLATVVVAAVTVPTFASAQDVGIRIGGDREMSRDRGEYRGDREYRGVRAEFRGHREGWHRGWNRDRDRVVIIKRRHHHWD
ncbi:MAG: hypothetical protein JWR49_3847 [Tardiphaga sp.]|nr:hypothetical protein [Tardiphaga sp.]